MTIEVDAIMENVYNDFITKYSFENGVSKAKTRRIDRDEANRQSIPEFYSRNPKRKRLEVKKSSMANNKEIESSLSPVRRRLESLNIQQPLQR